MTGWASLFLAIALLAAVLGFSGIADVSTSSAWVLFICSVIFALAYFGPGQKPRA